MSYRRRHVRAEEVTPEVWGEWGGGAETGLEMRLPPAARGGGGLDVWEGVLLRLRVLLLWLLLPAVVMVDAWLMLKLGEALGWR